MIVYLVVNIVVGMAVWISLVGGAAAGDLAIGAAVVSSGWFITYRLLGVERSINWRAFISSLYHFFAFFAAHVFPAALRSSWEVVRHTLAPARKYRPAFIAVDLEGLDPERVFMLAFALTLSPGEQVVAVDLEKGRILIHALHAPDPQSLRENIRRQYHYVKEIVK